MSYLQITSSTKLTNSAKSILTKLIDIKFYQELITHDGNDGEYFQSDIYDLYIITDNNDNTYTYYNYHMENWKDNKLIWYTLLEKPVILDKYEPNFFKTL